MSWHDIVLKRNWIMNRRNSQNNTSSSLKTWMDVFHPTLKVDYLSSSQHGSIPRILAKLFERIGWMVALPTMWVTKLLRDK
jgi:hypothetical protein